jgi:hypothetical protein
VLRRNRRELLGIERATAGRQLLGRCGIGNRTYVLAADLGRDEDVLESLAGLREDVAAKRELLDAAKERGATLSHRERHLRLVHRLGDVLLDEHEQWLDEVEQELAQP